MLTLALATTCSFLSNGTSAIITVGGIIGGNIAGLTLPTPQNLTGRKSEVWRDMTHSNLINFLQTENCSEYYSLSMHSPEPSSVHGVTTSTMLSVAEQCRNLVHLSVNFGYHTISDAGYVALLRANPNLESLAIYQGISDRVWGDAQEMPTQVTWNAIAQYCPKLQILTIEGNPTGASVVEALANLPFLTEIYWGGTWGERDPNLISLLLDPDHLKFLEFINGNPWATTNGHRGRLFSASEFAQTKAVHPRVFWPDYSRGDRIALTYGLDEDSGVYGQYAGGNVRVMGDPDLSFWGRREVCRRTSSECNAVSGTASTNDINWGKYSATLPGSATLLTCHQFCELQPTNARCAIGPTYDPSWPSEFPLANNHSGVLLTSAVQAYRPSDNSWTSLAPMPAPRAGMCASSLNAITYVTGGWDHTNGLDSIFRSVLAYDINANSWSFLPSMNKSRTAHVCGVLDNDKLVVAGGYAPTQCAHCPHNQGQYGQRTAEMFDIERNLWTPLPDMPEERVGSSAAVVTGGNQFIVAGGWNPSNQSHSARSDAVMVYDTTSNQWALIPSTQSRTGFALAGVRAGGEEFLHGGGHDGVNSWNTIMESYDVAAQGWAVVSNGSTNPLYQREGSIAQMLGDSLWVMGGRSPRVIPSVDNRNFMTFGLTCPERTVVKFSASNIWSSTNGTHDYRPLPKTSYSAFDGVACGLMYAASGVYFNCSAGSFAKRVHSNGAVTCALCPAGKHSLDRGQTSCKLCAAGKYVDVVGQSTCFQCGLGMYTNETGSQICHSCPSGRFAKNSLQLDSMESACCKAGQFCSESVFASLASAGGNTSNITYINISQYLPGNSTTLRLTQPLRIAATAVIFGGLDSDVSIQLEVPSVVLSGDSDMSIEHLHLSIISRNITVPASAVLRIANSKVVADITLLPNSTLSIEGAQIDGTLLLATAANTTLHARTHSRTRALMSSTDMSTRLHTGKRLLSSGPAPSRGVAFTRSHTSVLHLDARRGPVQVERVVAQPGASILVRLPDSYSYPGALMPVFSTDDVTDFMPADWSSGTVSLSGLGLEEKGLEARWFGPAIDQFMAPRRSTMYISVEKAISPTSSIVNPTSKATASASSDTAAIVGIVAGSIVAIVAMMVVLTRRKKKAEVVTNSNAVPGKNSGTGTGRKITIDATATRGIITNPLAVVPGTAAGGGGIGVLSGHAGDTVGDGTAVKDDSLDVAKMKQEKWYSRYVQTVTNTIEEAQRMHPGARIKMIGVQPDNHAINGARTRMEFNAVEQDILKAMRSGAVNKIVRAPEWSRVELQFLQDEIDAADNSDGKIHLIIASCPSQLGKDETIMQQVMAMMGSSTAVSKCYSEANNVATTLFGGL